MKNVIKIQYAKLPYKEAEMSACEACSFQNYSILVEINRPFMPAATKNVLSILVSYPFAQSSLRKKMKC